MSELLLNDMAQGSLEWHEHRAKYRNASEAAIIMECQPKFWNTSKRILWEQKQGLRGSNVDSDNPAIKHGNNMESFALACFNKNMKANTVPVVGVKGKYSASLDGYGTDSEGRTIKVEIKCPFVGTRTHTWREAADGKVAEHYSWQMVHQDYVVETEQSFFFVYISDDQFICIPHVSSEEDTAALLAAWDDFSENEPAPDWEYRSDDVILDLVTRHKNLLQQKSMLDVELKLAEKALKEEADGKNVLAFGAKIKTLERRGSIDYKNVPDLSGVDLEQYRKPSTRYTTITHEKETKNVTH